jgi:hypothetical protein
MDGRKQLKNQEVRNSIYHREIEKPCDAPAAGKHRKVLLKHDSNTSKKKEIRKCNN